MSTDFIRSMPKAELHVHLEGTVQPETVLQLAERHSKLDTLPGENEADLRSWFAFRDFPHFVQIYMTVQSLIRTAEDFSTIAYACGRDMDEQGILYRELTVTTYTHTHLQDKGLSIKQILEGLEDGRRRARRDFGVEMCWIFDIPRNASFGSDGSYDPTPADVTLAHALAGQPYGVVGLGLGGDEVGAPPGPFAHAFRGAIDAGLLSAPHAGETAGPSSVWGAVIDLSAHRIGHGVRAIEDPALLEHLVSKRIPLEISLVSNLCLGIYPSAQAHPFPHLDSMGIVVTVNSDDPPLFNTRLVDEYWLLGEAFGYGRADLARLARNGFRSAGAPAALKQELLAKFDRWAVEQLEITPPSDDCHD